MRILVCVSVLLYVGAAMGAESIYRGTPPGALEIKELPEAVAMESTSPRGYFEKQNNLFRVLFSYLKQNDLSMTVPVEADLRPGAMRFYVSSAEASETLKSTKSVTLKARPERLVASHGVRGAYTEENCRKALETLGEWLGRQTDYVAADKPYMVFWNSPFVPGILKKAEVHIPVRKKTERSKESEMQLRELTLEEKRVLIDKGTEAPFTGKYYKHNSKGVYICRQCGAALYTSAHKFASECGWPSFDDEIEGAVKRSPDADGRRTEILCQKCGGHLGHVFIGERLTAKNTRHCVNSVSLEFVPVERVGEAVFAGGCFWGVEYHLRRVPGVLTTTVGYTGGHKENPSYGQVCAHGTGHAEAVRVLFAEDRTDFEELAKVFFETHDPTQTNRQGPDVGDQYRSAIFYTDDAQKAVAEKLIKELRDKGLAVVTELQRAVTFWPAEDYHQDYYERSGKTPYCHTYTKRF